MAKTANKRGLGRGLSALIPNDDMEFLSRIARGETPAAPVIATPKDPTATQAIAPSAADQLDKSATGSKPQLIEVAAISPNPYQPRRNFSPQELEELAASVREHGVLQPILVRPSPPKGNASTPPFQLVAGERRWRAATAAGLTKIPVIIREVDDQQALELALIENVQRHDISPLDAAVAFRRLGEEFGLTQEAVAQRVGKSRSAVANTMRLLDLPAEAQKAIEDGLLSEGHGRAILLAENDGARRAVLRSVLRDNLSVRATEELARIAKATEAAPATAHKRNTRSSSTEMRALEEKLQQCLHTRVRLKTKRKGGQIIIEYFSEDELENLLVTLLK